MRVGTVIDLARGFQKKRAVQRTLLGTRAALAGADEIATLGRTFDDMAARLEASFRAIREAEQTLQAVIDAVPDGIRVIDQDFRILHANRAYREQLGLEPGSDPVGLPCHTSSHGRDTPCPPSLVTCPLHELAAGGTPIVCRHNHRRSDGGTLSVEVAAAPARLTVGGRPRPVVVEAIRDLHREMRISQEQRLSELGMLAAGVAHEIRNPLAAIRLLLHRLERGPSAGDPTLLGDLAAVGREIDVCIEVTERLLRLAVPPPARPELVELDRVVPETLSLLAAEAAARGIRCHHTLAPGLRVVATDSELRMLVLNLAQNAFHAMPGGGELRVGAILVGATVTLEFADTGVGIPPQDLARIFHPFWSRRADGVRGTGLGLSICRAIVARHGGRIEVASEPGRGTRVSVLLPAADGPAPP